MRLLPLLLAAAYGLPDADKIPVPDAARAARIGKALETIRTGDGAEVDAAVRDLALCGDVALPAIVKRLNEAEAGERLLLLAAASPMPRAAPLLEEARRDPHPAVRAWASGPPREREPPLRELAQRYLDLLAVAERRPYDDAEKDLKRLDDPLGRRPSTLEAQRQRMKDREVANAVQKERQRAATRFLLAGRQALARGELKPDLSDAVFVAFVGLLREEGEAASHAAAALVATGEAAAPALEEMLDRENHEPRKIARLLCAIRADRGSGLYFAFGRHRPDVQRALLDLAPESLEGAELLSLLERAALATEESVRTVALDALLALPAPAGREPARTLLDPERYGAAEFKRAAELLARCGDLEPLELFAALPVVPATPVGDPQRLSNLRATAQTALRAAHGDKVEAMGRRFLAADAKGLRTLGIDLVRDKDLLVAHARAEPAQDLVKAALLRLLALHPDAADVAVEILRARAIPADAPVVQQLAAAGRVDLLVDLAATEEAAVRALSNLPSIDPKFEPQLLALYDNATARHKGDTLAALLPLGTEEVRRRFEAAPDLALATLRPRIEGGSPSPFPFPLRRFLAGADGPRLRLLGDVAEGVPSLEPGFFFELFQAWEVLEGPGTEEGRVQEQWRLLGALSRTDDATSAKLLLERLLAGGTKEPALAMGTLMAAAKLLGPEDLARILPLLRAQALEERPRADKEAPPPSGLRDAILRSGFNALGYARVEAALDDLCDFVLDPALQPVAFRRRASAVPYWAVDALRDFPVATVDAAFRRALVRAEADGRLAACDPGDLVDLARACRGGFGKRPWERGRQLHEVAVAFYEVLARLPGPDDEVFERAPAALADLGRFAEAAAAARADATRKRARGYGTLDGHETPERVEAVARIYDAIAAKDAKALFAAAEASDDALVWHVAARYLRFAVVDVDLAARAGEAAVRGSAGLRRASRDMLASVRNVQGRPEDAVRLLDPHERVPASRPLSGLWYESLYADAYLQRGDELEARHALEHAASDRRVLPHLRFDPTFARFADVFRLADERFFDDVLFAREAEE